MKKESEKLTKDYESAFTNFMHSDPSSLENKDSENENTEIKLNFDSLSYLDVITNELSSQC